MRAPSWFPKTRRVKFRCPCLQGEMKERAETTQPPGRFPRASSRLTRRFSTRSIRPGRRAGCFGCTRAGRPCEGAAADARSSCAGSARGARWTARGCRRPRDDGGSRRRGRRPPAARSPRARPGVDGRPAGSRIASGQRTAASGCRSRVLVPPVALPQSAGGTRATNAASARCRTPIPTEVHHAALRQPGVGCLTGRVARVRRDKDQPRDRFRRRAGTLGDRLSGESTLTKHQPAV